MKGELKDQMNPQEFREYLKKREAGRDSKFGAIKTQTADGRTFDSIWEAEFYKERWVEQRAGEIKEIRHKVRYELIVNGYLVATYALDFEIEYTEKSPHWATYQGRTRYVDTKSSATLTEAFMIKKRLMFALFGIEVEPVIDPSLKKSNRVKKNK